MSGCLLLSLSLPVPDGRTLTARNSGVLAAVVATSGQRCLVSLLVDRISSLRGEFRLECILTNCIFAQVLLFHGCRSYIEGPRVILGAFCFICLCNYIDIGFRNICIVYKWVLEIFPSYINGF